MSEQLAHHHVVDGVSLAHHGELPKDFVPPTPETFAEGDAQKYGWTWLSNPLMYVSGRPVEHMQASRKVETFADIDIEGDQVRGPAYYYGKTDDWGRRSAKRLDSRDDLLSVLSDSPTIDLVDNFNYGCFHQHTMTFPVPHTSVALVPAKIEQEPYRSPSIGWTTRTYQTPTESFEEAEPSSRSGKWRRYGFAVLISTDFEPIDISTYRC